ncbi:GNAT family N-acetyltransferase [Candidatus Leptofilum sp.]|uniref:GNAT family N-acetyltransferase n=1 Tax=Candidatus Leptofilum sp. TaxID=3241576 RepID=UPI003B5B24F4
MKTFPKLSNGCWRRRKRCHELCSLVVHPDFVRRGVATALMATACQDALACGATKFWLDASLTAVPFYKATSWQPPAGKPSNP